MTDRKIRALVNQAQVSGATGVVFRTLKAHEMIYTGASLSLQARIGARRPKPIHAKRILAYTETRQPYTSTQLRTYHHRAPTPTLPPSAPNYSTSTTNLNTLPAQTCPSELDPGPRRTEPTRPSRKSHAQPNIRHGNALPNAPRPSGSSPRADNPVRTCPMISHDVGSRWAIGRGPNARAVSRQVAGAKWKLPLITCGCDVDYRLAEGPHSFIVE